MADAGAIGKPAKPIYEPIGDVLRFPIYAVGSVDAVLRQDGFYSGVVQLNGSPVQNCYVTLHWRRTMELIDRTWTDALGAYTFTGLNPDTDQYCVVCQDPEGGTLFNDQIIAQATPEV